MFDVSIPAQVRDSPNVLSPGGRLRKQLPRGPIVFTFHFIGVGNGTGGFKIRTWNRPFWNLGIVLSPEGTCACRLQKGYNCFLLMFYLGREGCLMFQFLPRYANPRMFYPPEGVCLADSEGVQLFYFPFYWCRKRYWGFQNPHLKSAFLKHWNCFIPRREAAEAAPKGSNWVLFPFNR